MKTHCLSSTACTLPVAGRFPCPLKLMVVPSTIQLLTIENVILEVFANGICSCWILWLSLHILWEGGTVYCLSLWSVFVHFVQSILLSNSFKMNVQIPSPVSLCNFLNPLKEPSQCNKIILVSLGKQTTLESSYNSMRDVFLLDIFSGFTTYLFLSER